MKFNHLTRQIFFLSALLFISILVIPILAGAGQAEPRVLEDMAGRSVVITSPVNKIVTTFKPASLCVFSLGLAHKLVGIDTSSKKDRMHQAIFPNVVNLAGVGSKTMGINFETLVSLKPDLVILYAQKDGLALAQRLDAMGIPSMVILPETFDTIKASLALIARAAGIERNPESVANEMDRILDIVNQGLKGLTLEGKKTGYFASARGVFNTATGNMLQDEIFTRAGVDNVSHNLTGYFQDISPEQLVKWNPDIVVISQHMKTGEARRIFDTALKEISAVAGHRVYRCPSSLAPWDFPSPLSALACLWTAQKTYPERFLDLDIKKIADEFHANLFGRTMSEMGGTLSDEIQ